jgi:hypothetical protein
MELTIGAVSCGLEVYAQPSLAISFPRIDIYVRIRRVST